MVYNIVQTLGWGYELLLILQLWTEKETIVLDIMNYQPLFYNLKLVQLLQFFDVFFGIVGVTKSNILFSFLQIFGRNFIVLAVFEYNFQSKMHIISIIPWCFADLVRYCYYLVTNVSFLEIAHPLCKWLRLSGFLILYPIGATGELLSIYDSWNILSEKCPFSIELPNQFNFSFDIMVFWGLFFMIQLLRVYTIYMSLLSARRKAYSKPELKDNFDVKESKRWGLIAACAIQNYQFYIEN